MSVMDRPTAAGKIRALDTPSAEGPIIGVITLNDANADPRNKDLFNDVLDQADGPDPACRCDRYTYFTCDSRDPQAFNVPYISIDSNDEDNSMSFEEIIQLVGEETAINLLHKGFSDVDLALDAMNDPKMAIKDKAFLIHKSVGSTAFLGLADLWEALSEAELLALSGVNPKETELPKLILALLKEARRELGENRPTSADDTTSSS